MSNHYFKKCWFPLSEYPKDFIPKGGKIFVGTDYGSPDGDRTVKGFYKDGVFHLQEIKQTKGDE